MISEEERKRRRLGVGASDVPVLFDKGWRDQDRYTLWLEKTGRLPDRESTLPPTDPRVVGTVLEDTILDWFERTQNVVLERDENGDRKREFREPGQILAVNLDGLLVTEEGKKVGVEAKWTAVEEGWGDHEGSVPDRVYLQVQAQCHAADLEGSYVVVFLVRPWAVEPRVYYVERNENMIREIVSRVEKFWYAHVKADIPPSVTRKALETVKTVDRESRIADISRRAVNRYEAALEAYADAKRRKDAAQAELLAEMRHGDTFVEVGQCAQKDSEYTFLMQQTTRFGKGKGYETDVCHTCGVGKKVSEFRVLRKRKMRLLTDGK